MAENGKSAKLRRLAVAATRSYEGVGTIILLVVIIVIDILHYAADLFETEPVMILNSFVVAFAMVVFLVHEIAESVARDENVADIRHEMDRRYDQTVTKLEHSIKEHDDHWERKFDSFLEQIRGNEADTVQSIEKKIEGIVTSFSFVSKHDNYKRARELLRDAEQCEATFLLRSVWGLQEGEEGYGQQIAGLPPQDIANRNEYFNELNAKVEHCELHYDWLVSVESAEKCCALVDRVTTLLRRSPNGIKGYFCAIHVIPVRTMPVVNFQITKRGEEEDIIFSLLESPAQLSNSIVLHGSCSKYENEKQLIGNFRKWFYMMKEVCTPIVDKGGVNLAGFARVCGDCKVDAAKFQPKIDLIRRLAAESEIPVVEDK